MKEILISLTTALLLVGILFTYLITNDKSIKGIAQELAVETRSNEEDISFQNELSNNGKVTLQQKEVNHVTETETKLKPAAANVATETEASPINEVLPPDAVVQESFNELTSERQMGSDIVVGYIWRTKTGSPKFQSLRIPYFDIYSATNEYRVDIWNGKSFVFYQNAKQAVDEIVFPEDGVSQFRVTGIDSSYRICPGERSRFTWMLTFTTAGVVDLERIPITIDGSQIDMECEVTY